MAESKFDKLAHHIREEYLKKGYSEEEATRISNETVADIGRHKYGLKKMEEKSEEGKEGGE